MLAQLTRKEMSMTVGELIAALQKLDPSLQVMGYSEDEALAQGRSIFRVFDISFVEVNRAKTWRGEDGTPMIRFENEDGARPIAFLDMTIDF